MKKVTVLVAIYKASKFLSVKLDNLKQQTIFDDSEIILLNCQNIENEEEIYKEFALLPNVRTVTFPEHVTLYHSWNCGIAQSDSQYIVNANTDDLWHPTYLEKCCYHLDNEQSSVVSTGVLVTDRPNQIWPNWQWFGKMPLYTFPLSSAGPCPVWRRALHDKYGMFEDLNVISDARMWEKWYYGKEIFGLIPEYLALYYASIMSLERRRNDDGQLLSDIDRCNIENKNV